MTVGEDEPVRRNDDARAGALYPVALGAARYEGRNSLTTADEKGDDGRTNAIDHVDDGARIGVK